MNHFDIFNSMFLFRRKYFVALMIPFIFAQCFSFKERVIREYEIKEIESEMTLPFDGKFPSHVGVVVRTSNGFASWNDILKECAEVEIVMEMIAADKTTKKYLLSFHDFSDANLMKPFNEDGRSDMGWHFYYNEGNVETIKLHVLDKKNVLSLPIKIKLLRLN